MDSFRQTVGLTVCILLHLLLAGVVLHDKFSTVLEMQKEINSLKLVRFITKPDYEQSSATKLKVGWPRWERFRYSVPAKRNETVS